MVDSENDLLESTKFWLVQPQNLLIIYRQQNILSIQPNCFVVLPKSESNSI